MIRVHILPSLLIAASLLFTATRAHADDVVFLKGGGRLRGTVVEEDPKTGVRVKLLDGTVRGVSRAEIDHVEYAPTTGAPATPPAEPTPPAPPSAQPPQQILMPTSPTGRLVVKGSVPGSVFLDRGQVGRTPYDMPALSAGLHRVSVDFDGGGSTTTMVTVIAGQTTEVVVERSAAAEAFSYRRGIHIGLTGGAVLYAGSLVGFGGSVMPFVNLAAAPAFDVRLGPVLTGSNGGKSGDSIGGSKWSFGGDLSGRFNLGSFYTMAVGVRASYMSVDTLFPPDINDGDETRQGFALAGEISPVIVRFGPHREIEAGYTAALEAIIGHNDVWLRNELSVTYLFTQF